MKYSISFIIPAYNCENYIEEAILSIYETNYRSGDEIVVVNDKSTDNTLKVVKRFARADCRVKVISHSLQKGGGAARNTAVEHAKNQLIFCLDSDNILAPRSIDKLKNLLLSTNADVATFQKLKYFKTSTSNINHEWVFQNDIYDMRNYLSSNIVPGASGNYLFTKNSWHKAGRYPEDQGALDTWGFGLRQVMTGSVMAVLRNSHYFHRIGHESYWIRESKKANISLLATQLIIPFMDLLDPRDQDYIFSRKYRKIWFDRLNARSIHINENKTSKIRKVIEYLNKII